MNHKLQKKPSFLNRRKNSSNSLGFHIDQCPIGTIPIRRTTSDDLFRGKLYLDNILSKEIPGKHVAEVTLVPGTYYGVGATSSVYSIKVEKGQSSAAVIWVKGGSSDNTNYIGVGWHVAPELYNDDGTHFYVVWTADNFKKTGCYNLQCPGFVQTSSDSQLGGRFDKTSTQNGEMIQIEISIYQDPKTKNWWIYNTNKMLGYFPSSIVPNLASAVEVGWTGQTRAPVNARSPPMGSGSYPDRNIVHASYFTHISYQDGSRTNQEPSKESTRIFSDAPNCYRAEYYGDEGSEYGHVIQFGGPGGDCGN
ncbi:protein neprosin-like [Vicia villosa]|uniref:protein neprosin-like n=1 Tax=Vicia villosa TaxID=3911 RepID=UPI00273B5BA2|nr:protein neprosin-like [Vicia villosa]